jgi:flagellar biosynthesis protein FliQ
MDQNSVINIAQDALMIVLYVSAPMLGLSLIVGLAVSIFQATTQIQEQTLTFVPKLIAVALVGLVTGSWMLHTIISFTTRIFEQIASILK